MRDDAERAPRLELLDAPARSTGPGRDAAVLRETATGGHPPDRASALVALGLLCGLAWAAGLRGWMAQIAGDSSSFGWAGTFALVLLPGAAVGGLLAWAEHLRRCGSLSGARRRWLVASPLLFAVALADPEILESLVTNGQGSGALAIAVVGLCGGHAIGSRGPLLARVVAGLVAVLLTAAGATIGPLDERVSGAHLTWMAVHITTLLVILSLACAVPHRTSLDEVRR